MHNEIICTEKHQESINNNINYIQTKGGFDGISTTGSAYSPKSCTYLELFAYRVDEILGPENENLVLT